MMQSTAILAFCGLVAIQTSVGIVYKFAGGSSGKYDFSQSGSLALSEATKLCLSFLFLSSSYRTIKNLSRKEQYGMVTLAAAYAINNHLAFYLFTLADPGTINLVKSSSSVVSAIVLWKFADRHPLRIQWVAIVYQMMGLLISQYNDSTGASSYSPLVYLLIFLSTLISSCSGCFNDYITKASSLSLHALNVWLYAAGFAINFFIFLFNTLVKPDEPGLFDGYNGWGFGVLVCNSLIGIAVTAVYKYGDAVIKCFAMSASTAILLLISVLFLNLTLRFTALLGCILIFLSSFMYLNPTMLTEPVPRVDIAKRDHQEKVFGLDNSKAAPTGRKLSKRLYVVLGFVALLTIVIPTLPLSYMESNTPIFEEDVSIVTTQPEHSEFRLRSRGTTSTVTCKLFENTLFSQCLFSNVGIRGGQILFYLGDDDNGKIGDIPLEIGGYPETAATLDYSIVKKSGSIPENAVYLESKVNVLSSFEYSENVQMFFANDMFASYALAADFGLPLTDIQLVVTKDCTEVRGTECHTSEYNDILGAWPGKYSPMFLSNKTLIAEKMAGSDSPFIFLENLVTGLAPYYNYTSPPAHLYRAGLWNNFKSGYVASFIDAPIQQHKFSLVVDTGVDTISNPEEVAKWVSELGIQAQVLHASTREWMEELAAIASSSVVMHVPGNNSFSTGFMSPESVAVIVDGWNGEDSVPRSVCWWETLKTSHVLSYTLEASEVDQKTDSGFNLKLTEGKVRQVVCNALKEAEVNFGWNQSYSNCS